MKRMTVPSGYTVAKTVAKKNRGVVHLWELFREATFVGDDPSHVTVIGKSTCSIPRTEMHPSFRIMTRSGACTRIQHESPACSLCIETAKRMLKQEQRNSKRLPSRVVDIIEDTKRRTSLFIEGGSTALTIDEVRLLLFPLLDALRLSPAVPDPEEMATIIHEAASKDTISLVDGKLAQTRPTLRQVSEQVIRQLFEV